MSDEHFLYDSAEDQPFTEDEASAPKSRFPVRTQLVFLSLVLLVLFGGLIIPKSQSLLGQQNPEGTQPASSVQTEDTPRTNATLGAIDITAQAAFVLDQKTGSVLFEKNADTVLPLASITKLMTALVAYELVTDDTPITVSETAAKQQSGGTLQAGEVFKARDLADFALISSYNSAAYTLADGVGRLLGSADPVAQFVAAMNIKAEELQLTSLTYKNPTGLDLSLTEAGAYGSARDTSYLLAHILTTHPEILTPTLTEYTRLYSTGGNFHEAHNTNNILEDIPNLLGSKTGYTDLAGGNLTIAYDAGFNHPIIITVLGSTRNERFADILRLVAAVENALVTSP